MVGVNVRGWVDRERVVDVAVHGARVWALVARPDDPRSRTAFTEAAPEQKDVMNRNFGDFGGRYIPETLAEAHRELEAAYAEALADPKFHEEIAFYRREFIGKKVPLVVTTVA